MSPQQIATAKSLPKLGRLGYPDSCSGRLGNASTIDTGVLLLPSEQHIAAGQQTHQRADRHRRRILKQVAIADDRFAPAISAPSLAAVGRS